MFNNLKYAIANGQNMKYLRTNHQTKQIFKR